MKITRINQSEGYNITSDWLNDFANNIVKESNFIDRVRERRDISVKDKFATIEDKMADIKERIGYRSSEDTIKTASCQCDYACDCEPATCECKENDCPVCFPEENEVNVGNIDDESLDNIERDVFAVKAMLKYIIQIISKDGHMPIPQIINVVRRDPSHSKALSLVCPDKLKSFIEPKLPKRKALSGPGDISYIGSGEWADFGDIGDGDQEKDY